MTDDGWELPVVDVTHPAFAFDVSEPALAAAIADTLETIREFKTLSPPEIQTLAQSSILLRSGLQARGGVLGGMATYLNRLGPANLGSYASDWDRRAAGQLLPLAFRHRVATMARLLADRLIPALAIARGPVHLFNIGGGTGIDSLNALILASRAPGALAGRPVVIHVLDPDTAGPAFGARALVALRSEGGPLRGLDVGFEHVPYNWADTAPLASALQQANRGDAVIVASSEGALLEYGSDEHIVGNLRVLAEHAPAIGALVGTVLKDKATLPDGLKWIGDASGVAVRLLGLGALRELAGQAGWTVDRVEDGPIHHIVALRREAPRIDGARA